MWPMIAEIIPHIMHAPIEYENPQSKNMKHKFGAVKMAYTPAVMATDKQSSEKKSPIFSSMSILL
jgi:hypothetical protein